MEWAAAIVLAAFGIWGIVLHVQASLGRGPFAGDDNMISFVVGPFMAFVCLSGAIMLATS